MARSARLPKLSAPRPSRIHPRRRLFRRLDTASRAGAVWIQGPPGAGKTALVTSWIAERRLRHLWYRLDAGDADVATFFEYLGRAAAGLGRSRRPLPAFTPEHLASPTSYARHLFRAVGERLGRGVLVLDEYHEVPAGSSLDLALREGIAALPEGVTAVIVSRDGPPPALARMRLSGALHVVSPAELRLDVSETRAIARLWGVVGRRGAERLERADGWAAGVVLLLASVEADGSRDCGDARAVPRALFDYLGEEVLSRADAETRTVLLQTALLPDVTPEAAVRLTGVSRAGEILAGLARAGYFTVRHEGKEASYRFHELFRDFLLSHAERTFGPAELQARRLAAARLLADGGRDDEAVELMLGAAAWDEAARLVRTSAPALLRTGRAATVSGWIARLPEKMREEDPWLLYWRGASLFASRPDEARAPLERALQAFESHGDGAGAWLAWSALVELRFYTLEDMEPLEPLLVRLHELERRFPAFPSPQIEAAVIAATLTAYVHRRPWSLELRRWVEKGMEIALGGFDPALRLHVGRPLALYLGYWGTDVPRARVLIDVVGPLAAQPGGDGSASIFWLVAESDYYEHVSEPDACISAAARGLAIARDTGLRLWEPVLLSVKVWGELLAGRVSSAGETLRQLAATTEGGASLARCLHHYTASILALWRGDPQAAVEHGRTAVGLADASGMPLAQAGCRVPWALASELVPAARPGVLEESLAFARQTCHRYAELGCLFALALVALRRGHDAAAVARLAEAFPMAKSMCCTNINWIPSRDFSDLCAVALEHDIEAEFAAEIVKARRLPPGARARDLERWPWPLRIEALGGLAVHRDGNRIEPAGKVQRKPLELLRLLVVGGPGGVRADAAEEALWPHSDGDAARHALETTVYRLRRLLGDANAVVQRSGRISLDGSRAFVDAWALERLVKSAQAAYDRGDCSTAAALEARVDALHRGDLFGDEPLEPYLAAERERLRRLVERGRQTRGRRAAEA